MIEALLQIADRLLLLKNFRAERKRRLWDEILNPTFEDLLLIHADYIKMFEDVEKRLTHQPQEPFVNLELGVDAVPTIDGSVVLAAARELRQRRLEFEPIRVKVRAMIETLNRVSVSPEIDRFVRSLLAYFPNGALHPDTPARRLLAEIYGEVELTKQLYIDRYTRHVLYEFVRRHIMERRQLWAQVCEAYAGARVSLAAGHSRNELGT